MVLPDGSAAPGALPTYSGGGSLPPPAPLRPNNMLAAIQSMPPAEKRAMLVSALKRALPIMMQTAQVGGAQVWAAWLMKHTAAGMTHTALLQQHC